MASAATTPHIELRGIGKRFGGVTALADVDLSIGQGTIHGLVGENGAGKSTLGKVIAGVHRPDAGTMLVDGREAAYGKPREALADGLTIIAQELALEMHRTVRDNVFLGSEHSRFGFLERGVQARRFAELIERTGFRLDPDARVGALRTADQQKVEILRALAREARLIVMDEPTAALTHDEAQHLFEVIRTLGRQGTTVVYVSHSLGQVLSLTSQVTVLRDGRLVETRPSATTTSDDLVRSMLGRPLELLFPDKAAVAQDAPVVLEVKGLTTQALLRDVTFSVRAGEIVGLAGLIGSGRSEIARAVFGADPVASGTVELDGRPLDPSTPRDAIRAGVAMLPESRKKQGLNMQRPIMHNVTLAALGEVSDRGFIRSSRERALSRRLLEQVRVTTRLSAPVSSLSGGNQQRVLFAKWLVRRPRLLIVDEPSRGVDVGAIQAIHDLIAELAREGIAVLMISSEHEEVLGLAHRTLVMREGRIVRELAGPTATEQHLLPAALGTTQEVAA